MEKFSKYFMEWQEETNVWNSGKFHSINGEKHGRSIKVQSFPILGLGKLILCVCVCVACAHVLIRKCYK